MRYEDLVRHPKELDGRRGRSYFAAIFRACGIDQVPADWRERVRIGSDRKQSGTARENLTGLITEVPDELSGRPQAAGRFAFPGVRQLLGYE